MTIQTSLIGEIEDAIATGSNVRRTHVLRSITDLFLSGAESFSDDQIALFDDVIQRLAKYIEAEARAELAKRLASLHRAPPSVIKTLASDDVIDVATPVLEQSPQLRDDDLVDIAKSKSQGHLLAISRRKTLAEIVTDVLVWRGDQHVARSVAENEGALFSTVGFDTLVARSESDTILAGFLSSRKDLTPSRLRKLIGAATKIARERLARENPRQSDDLDESISQVTSDLSSDSEKFGQQQIAAKKRMMEALFSSGKLDENELQTAASNGKFEDVVAALSMLCSMSTNTVRALLLDHHVDVILILAKASELSWTTARSLLVMQHGGYATCNVDLEAAFENFKHLQVATAQRILRFYRVRLTAVQSN